MKATQYAVMALTMAAIAVGTSGCLVGQERTHSRVVVSEPAGAPVYHDEYYGRGYHDRSYDRQDGYYDSRGYWHPSRRY